MLRRFLVEFFRPVRENKEVFYIIGAIIGILCLMLIAIQFDWILPVITIFWLGYTLFLHTRNSWRRAKR